MTPAPASFVASLVLAMTLVPGAASAQVPRIEDDIVISAPDGTPIVATTQYSVPRTAPFAVALTAHPRFPVAPA